MPAASMASTMAAAHSSAGGTGTRKISTPMMSTRTTLSQMRSTTRVASTSQNAWAIDSGPAALHRRAAT